MGRLVAIIFVNVLVFIVLLAGATGVLEVYLRLRLPQSSGGSIFEYTLSTKRYKLMRPNAEVVAWGVELATNNLGFRDDTPTIPEKQPDERRVIVLGDSFTVSAGVPYSQIYTQLLERELREQFPTLRVINLGVGGYNLVQYEIVFREIGLGLEPDIVLVGLFPDNDFDMADYRASYERARDPTRPRSAETSWYQQWYVYRAYLWRLESAFWSYVSARTQEGNFDLQRSARAEGWRKNATALKNIVASAEATGIPMAAVLLPSTWAFSKQLDAVERVEALCQENHIPYLNLLPSFMASGVSEATLRLNVLDAHPNEEYHSLVTQSLAPFLARLLRRDAEVGDS